MNSWLSLSENSRAEIFKQTSIQRGLPASAKAFLLHEEFQNPIENIRKNRLSRHLYDLEKLMDTSHGQDALKDVELYRSIVAHRQMFNVIRGIDYSNHKPNMIDFLPPDQVIKDWEKDYSVMRESMIYGKSLSFSKLLKRISVLKDRFRLIKS